VSPFSRGAWPPAGNARPGPPRKWPLTISAMAQNIKNLSPGGGFPDNCSIRRCPLFFRFLFEAGSNTPPLAANLRTGNVLRG
jgi:hypothetical protein